MHNILKTIAIVSVVVAGFAVAPALHADDFQAPSGSMMNRGGMMGQGGMMGMMGQMGSMMEHCNGMMKGMDGTQGPNDQWREGKPSNSEKKH